MKRRKERMERKRKLREIVLFFFQAEDGIRDIGVTGVQTCALPIYPIHAAVMCRTPRAVERRRGPRATAPVGASKGRTSKTSWSPVHGANRTQWSSR